MTDPSQYFKGRTVQEQMNEVIGYVDTRAAEVATDAIAADVAQVHQDMLDADADATAAAASAAAAAGTLANAVKKTGEASQSIDGNISIQTDLGVGQDANVGGALTVSGDGTVNGNLYVAGTGDFTGAVTVPTPTANTDAANKKYVDDLDVQDVKLTGAQTVAGVKTFSSSPVVPTEATGTFSTKAASSDKVKNELDNYNTMVRTANDQNIGGVKTFAQPIVTLAPKTFAVKATAGYFKIARFTVNPRYYSVGILANSGASTALSLIKGQFNNNVWTCTSETVGTLTGTPNVLKIGVGTVDGEKFLIAHVLAASSVTILITGSNIGTSGEVDALRLTTNEAITVPSDYQEGDAIV